MRFRRLKLSGFKSFVEPAELRIEPGLTGVVGPNGCGKSNLLEAIRWVMGEGSPKSLRGGGMEDVIFAGTATRPARDFAEVSLLIERGAEEADNDEGGESEVTRRIERGAGSAYRIDGRDVRQKDVSLLFADQAQWIGKIQAADAAQMQALQTMSPAQQFSTIADLSGLKQYASTRGLPAAKAEQCLANEAEANQLVQMNNDATASYNIPGTPSFLINGSLVESTHSWEALEPKIKEALAS